MRIFCDDLQNRANQLAELPVAGTDPAPKGRPDARLPAWLEHSMLDRQCGTFVMTSKSGPKFLTSKSSLRGASRAMSAAPCRRHLALRAEWRDVG